MLESMTGYGRGEAKTKRGSINLEVKSVNSKYLEIKNHLPKQYAVYDSKISSYLKKLFNRGNIDVFLSETEAPKKYSLIDFKKAARLYSEAKHLQKDLNIKGDIDISTFLKCKDFLYPEKESFSLPFNIVKRALVKAATNLKNTRLKEGKNLGMDIRSRLKKVAEAVFDIETKSRSLPEDVAQRLSKRISEISKDIQMEPGRIEQEVVIYAAKADIAEELTRLKSHLKRMQELLNSKGPCGRNIDFTIQEMNREVNTIGSKAQSSEISKCVIELKGEMERIREQIQNIA